MKKYKIICVIGTRPEVIKMAPIIDALKKSSIFEVIVVSSGQHRQLLDQALLEFNIQVDRDLKLMTPNQDLIQLNANLLLKLKIVLDEEVPHVVLAQGDTTTVFATALACFYKKIPFGHVEAGLRTGNFQSPFPEEMNRVFTSKISKWHFSPTLGAKNNLVSEGISSEDIYVVGNTVIDSLLMKSKNLSPIELITVNPDNKLILVTVHRRENFGSPLISICNAINKIVELNPSVQVFVSVHPNPNTKKIIEAICGKTHGVILSDPLGYTAFVGLMNKAHFIMSDSGGIQEEAPALGKPVLVLRLDTERPEALEGGTVKLIGSHADIILEEANRLINDAEYHQRMSKKSFPYGRGDASTTILGILEGYFKNLE